MGKDIEWLKSWFDDDKSYTGEYVKFKINHIYGVENLTEELPVIPKYVADWIDENREWYENKFFTIGYDLYDHAIHRFVGDWIIENEEKFVRAWLDGYEVEVDICNK